MTHASLEQFFMWATIVGVGVMVLGAPAWMLMRGVAHRIHGRIFGVSPEVVDIVCYAYLALMKVMVTILLLVPWIALMLTRPAT